MYTLKLSQDSWMKFEQINAWEFNKFILQLENIQSECGVRINSGLSLFIMFIIIFIILAWLYTGLFYLNYK